MEKVEIAEQIKYSDSDLTFYLQVYQDYNLANWCLANLRDHYPECRIIVVSDGDDDPRYQRFIERYAVDYTLGERFYLIEHGGEMLQRMLELYLLKPTKWLCKIDTDTKVCRKMKYMPKDWEFFGRGIEKITREQNIIQGGCMFYSLEAAKKLVESRIFLSEWREREDWAPINLRHFARTWAKKATNEEVHDFLVDAVQSLCMIRQEWVAGYCCSMLDIKIQEFLDVWSKHLYSHLNLDLEHAIVHPCEDKYPEDPNMSPTCGSWIINRTKREMEKRYSKIY